MSDQKIIDDFYLSLVEFLLQAKQQVVAVSAEFGLSSMQALTLLVIDNRTPRSMSTYRKLYDCDASNITGIMDGLEQKGLVSRQVQPGDRRIKVIKLEPAGRKVQVELTHRLAERDDFLFDALSVSEKQAFVRIINKISAYRHSTANPVGQTV